MIDPAEVVRREALIEDVAISADGALVAYSRRTVVAGRHVRLLWTVPWSSGRPRRITTGRHLDHSPAFSPDGRQLAFLSDRDRGVDQVWVVPAGGGEPRAVTRLAGGVTAFAWQPDGDGLVVTAHVLADGAPPVARTIARLDWRDEDGYGRMDRPTHVFAVPLAGDARQLTDGPWFCYEPGFLPDGRIGFLADRRSDGDRHPHRVVAAVSPRGGSLADVLVPGGSVVSWAVTARGAIACLAYGMVDAPDDDPAQISLDGAPVPGQRDLFATLLSNDGGAAVISELGLERVVAVEPDGVADVLGADRLATVDAIASAGGRIAAVATLGTGFPEVYALEAGRAPRQLTTHGADWFRRLPQPRVEEVAVAGPDGPIATWILTPPGAPAGPLATVVAFHGGPVWAWGPAPELGIQLLVQAGYRVALPNIRGSYGFGRGWIADLEGRWGDVDAADVHAVCDHLVATGLADPARLGCFGRSYGGFLVNWLLGTSDRFAAGVSECGVANQVSSFANSDCGHTYNTAAGLGDPLTPEGVALLWRQSPLRNVRDIRTPLLLLQGEDDLRCPTSDVEQLFVAMRWLRREVSYVLYPECGHYFHRTGRPDRRIDRHERLVGWFRRHMPVP